MPVAAPYKLMNTVYNVWIFPTVWKALYCLNISKYVFIYCCEVRALLEYGFMGFWAKCWMDGVGGGWWVIPLTLLWLLEYLWCPTYNYSIDDCFVLKIKISNLRIRRRTTIFTHPLQDSKRLTGSVEWCYFKQLKYFFFFSNEHFKVFWQIMWHFKKSH